MSDWRNLSARFTEEEMKVIEQVQKVYKWNRSQLVRASVRTSISVLLANALTMNEKSPLVQAMLPILKKMFPEEKRNEIEQGIEKIKAENPELVKKAEEDAKILSESMKPFETHNRRGAPKRKAGKRGRPKD